MPGSTRGQPARTPVDQRRAPPDLPASSPRATATYLHDLRPLLKEGAEARRSFVHEIGSLMDESSRANRLVITQAAGRVGRDHAGYFLKLKARVDALVPPPSCLACHVAVERWLECHVQASRVMAEVGRTGELARMHATQRLLGEARGYARQLNGEYSRLVEELRQRVRAATRRARSPR